MKTLKSLLVLCALFLSGCSSLSVRDDLPASDLDALEASVSRHLQPRALPGGLTYCAELSRTEREQDACLGDLEDALAASNADKARGLGVLARGLDRLRLARRPCRWFDFACKARARSLAGERADERY